MKPYRPKFTPSSSASPVSLPKPAIAVPPVAPPTRSAAVTLGHAVVHHYDGNGELVNAPAIREGSR